ncbi:MAG: hypothetical protein GXP33_07710 [Spirochaetes bacterium]|nr:hypothetical protein [Spirochaetota bacterium]
MFSFKKVRRIIIFIFLTALLTGIVIPAFSETITVYDGSVTGVDADWWNSGTAFSADWTDDIDWSAYTDDKWYRYSIEHRLPKGDWVGITNGIVPDNPDNTTPPKSVTVTGLSLLENNNYRIRIDAYHGYYGSNEFQIPFTGINYSDGVTTDFTNPAITGITSEYTLSSDTYDVSWGGSDDNSGVANYDVQYRPGGGTWTDWPPETGTTGTNAVFTGTSSATVHFRVRVYDKAGNASGWTNSDTTPPTAEISGLAATQTSNNFTVSWTGSDTESSIAYYDVQYRVGINAWQDWQVLTTGTSAGFTGNNGQAYSFRVRAHDSSGNIGSWPDSTAAETVINSMSASMSLSASPSSLSFSSTDNSASLTLSILATGGNITVNSIAESRNYPSRGNEEETPESVAIPIPGGITHNENLTVGLDNIQRTKALSTGTEGGFALTYTVSAADNNGNPISASVSVPVTVSGGLPAVLSVTAVSLQLPPSPYYAGDTVRNARVTIEASGSGTVSGRILVDGDTSWSDNPTFNVTVNDTTNFDIQGNLPTDVPGSHTVRVEITSPLEMSTEEVYTISSSTPPFPPQTLILVKDVAELTDLNGTANAVNGDGYKEFIFTGTAKMKLLSMKDDSGNPRVLNDVTVTSLVVRYNNDNPAKAKIRGGTAEKEVTGNEVIATIGKGYLRVKKVSFTGQVSPPADYLRVDTKLYIPKLNMELLKIGDLILKSGGIESKGVSVKEEKAKTFNSFGMQFRIHDVDGEQGIVVGKDIANDRYYFSLSGGISMNEKKGTTTTKKEITTFKGLTFYTDGSIDGTITFNKSFDIIPDILTLNKIQIQSESDNLKMKLAGELKNLPYPLDSLGTTAFEFTFDKDGNTEGMVVPVHELVKNNRGHGLGGSDSTEWDLGIGNIDVTYLALHLVFNAGNFDEDHSEIQIGTDIYLNIKNQDGSNPAEDEKRISFGELNANGDFTGGIRVSMNGDFTWNAPTNAAIIQNKKLDLAALTIKIDALGINTEPFRVVFTGGIIVGLEGVTGAVNFENLEIGLDGTVSNLSDAITGGTLNVADVVHIEVDDVDWSNTPATITFQSNATTGEGKNRAPQKSDKSVDVESYIRIMGASINIGSVDDPVMSGGFDELTVYKPVGGSKSFVLRNVNVSTSDVELHADIEYASSLLRVAGEISLPNDITAVAVGKIGSRNGKPTMGIFIAAAGLSITVGPGVFLDEIGGGIFINPVQEDIDLVRYLARFERPELDDDITSKRPGGEGNPGSFAVMLLGGVYVAEKDIVQGRALITITANYFNLDAEVEVLDGLLNGTAYLAVGWSPAYGEGNVVVNMDFLSILGGQGSLAFYVYSGDTWGVSGAFNISMLGQDISSGSLFVGPPGFMVEANVTIGLDIKIISGSLTYSGMFWYYKVPDPDTWGAYVHVNAKGEFLAGLLSAEAGLEGALIGSPTFVVYAVGTVKFKVLYVTVFKGSLWISLGENGFHGGKGRNAQYDGIIEDARNMADTMNQAKEELARALNDAKLELARLNAAQQEAAGLALVERSGIIGGLVDILFQSNEYNHWKPNGLPPMLQQTYNRIFGPGQQALMQARTDLQRLKDKINQDINKLDQLQQEVAVRLSEYEDILIEELPSVQEIGSLSNPFQGMEEKNVSVGGTTKRVKTGFRIDESKANSQRTSLSNLREDFAKYQDAFIKQSGLIDAKMQQLDEILFMGDNNLGKLSSGYSNVYSEMGRYIERFVQFQDENYKYSDESLKVINFYSDENRVRNAMAAKARHLSPAQLGNWNTGRIRLIQSLLQAGSLQEETEQEAYNPPEGISPPQLFTETGVQLWWNIPVAGFTASKQHSIQRRAQALQSFRAGTLSFTAKWASATSVINQIFEKKSEMYNILYEIYDQLAVYGSGEIGIASDGNAAGIAGLSGAGLAFRTSAVAASVKQDAVQLPSGTTSPKGPVIGPLRPAAPSSPRNKGRTQFKGRTSVPKTGPRIMHKSRHDYSLMASPGIIPGLLNGVDIPLLADAGGYFTQPGSSILQSGSGTNVQSGLKGNSYGTIKLGENSGGLPEYAGIDRDLGKYRYLLTPVEWVPVTRYFEGKRAEIEPYLTVPSVKEFSGTVTSRNEFTALLAAQFSGTHPVGVVEYEYRIEPAGPAAERQGSLSSSSQLGGAAVQANNNLVSGSGGTGGIIFMPIQLTAFPIIRPWFSLGDNTSLNEPFFPDINSPGEYYLYLKVRGAGGKSIIRRATISLKYFNPETNSRPVSSSLDTSDKTPPAKPVVTLEGPYTYRTDLLYAKWNSSDLESGIQNYDYAVGTYRPSLNISGQTTTSLLNSSTQSVISQSAPGTLEMLTGSSSKGTIQGTVPGGADSTGGLAVPVDILPWKSAGGRTELNIRGLNLEQGKKYVVSVRAANGVGLKSIGTSDPILVDTTPPVNTAVTALEQVSADGYSNSIRFSFDAGEDPESGISAKYFAIGTSEGSSDLIEWREAENNTAIVVNLPLPDGSTVYIQIKAVNGAGLETTAHDSLVINYTDSSAPPGPLVVTFPPDFTSDTSKLAFGWDKVTDGESGITGYQYGISTNGTYPDIVPWSAVPLVSKPYVLQQGTKMTDESGSNMGKTASDSKTLYYIEKEGLNLLAGQSYYIMARVTNGVNLTSVGVSSSITIDTSSPDQVSVTASKYSTSRGKLTVRIRARDLQSGIKAYRFAVWTVPEISQSSNNSFVVPVSGSIAGGVFQGSAQVQGFESSNTAKGFPGSGSQSTQGIQQGANIPLRMQDMDLWGPPWFESDWISVSSGVPPESIDLNVDIKGFPTGLAAFINAGQSLRYGKSYRVKVWVQNGAGIETDAGIVVIKVVRGNPNIKGSSFDSGRKSIIPRIKNTGM